MEYFTFSDIYTTRCFDIIIKKRKRLKKVKLQSSKSRDQWSSPAGVIVLENVSVQVRDRELVVNCI